jgi:predicted enzyme related to lactoylglutathione lyase
VTNTPGSWNFSDLHTGDATTAIGFCAPLFGWEFDAIGWLAPPETATITGA